MSLSDDGLEVRLDFASMKTHERFHLGCEYGDFIPGLPVISNGVHSRNEHSDFSLGLSKFNFDTPSIVH